MDSTPLPEASALTVLALLTALFAVLSLVLIFVGLLLVLLAGTLVLAALLAGVTVALLIAVAFGFVISGHLKYLHWLAKLQRSSNCPGSKKFVRNEQGAAHVLL